MSVPVPFRALVPEPLILSVPLVAMAILPPTAPPAHTTFPTTVSTPAPANVPPPKPRTPSVWTVLAPLRVRSPRAFVSVCMPLAPPRVRLATVTWTFCVTV